MKTRQQQDALCACKHVQGVADSNDPDLKKTYARAVYRFPILIRQNGLQQTLGFYAGKAAADSGKAEKSFLGHVADALGLGGQEDVVSHILDVELEQYLYLSRRCLEVAVWYRRFTESILKIDPTGNSGLDKEAQQSVEEGQ